MTLFDSDSRHDHHPSEDVGSTLVRFVSSPVRVALSAVAIFFALDAVGTDDGPGLCIFRRCTGGYCPGCGMTRSARHVSRAEFAAAWQDHPWLILGAAQLVVAAAILVVARRVGRTIDRRVLLGPIAVVNIALIVGIWVVRLVDGSIPRPFG